MLGREGACRRSRVSARLIAPLLIGDGRPAIRLRPPDALGDCHRPRYRVFRMGADVLFDCDLTAGDDQASQPEADPPITRVI